MFPPILLALLSALLLSLAWPNIGGLTPLMFIALIPALWMSDQLIKRNKGVIHFFLCWLLFALWNFGTTYWLFHVTESTGTRIFSLLGPALANSLIMAIIWQLYYWCKNYVTPSKAALALMMFWLGYEYFHLNWELSWTWLTLGNAFANTPNWIQWYEYTGVHGGSLWVLWVNISIFNLLQRVINKEFHHKANTYMSIGGNVLFILVPIIWSLNIKSNYSEKGEEATVVVIQPNYNPYTEKFSIPYKQQLREMIDLGLTPPMTSVDLIVFPETALQEPSRLTPFQGDFLLSGLWTSNLKNSYSYKEFQKNITIPYGPAIIAGMACDELLNEQAPESHLTRPIQGTNKKYISYNSALFINRDTTTYYHKSKLVPGVEIMPYAWLLTPMKSIAISLGGTSGGLGTQKEASVFKDAKSGIVAAPIICYESVYGEYVGEFIKKGANLITIITNDGWWSNTAGHEQHWAYAKLRAIETRRSVARSANTGISGFINQKGEVLAQSEYEEKTTLRQKLLLNEELTFYTLHGDYIGRNALFLSILMWLYTLSIRIRKGKQ